MRKKGFLFTIDALLAIAIIVAAGFALFMMVQETDSDVYSMQLLRVRAGDEAMVGFYTGNSASDAPRDFLALNETAYCSSNLRFDASVPAFSDINYCEGK